MDGARERLAASCRGQRLAEEQERPQIIILCTMVGDAILLKSTRLDNTCLVISVIDVWWWVKTPQFESPMIDPTSRNVAEEEGDRGRQVSDATCEGWQ